MSVQAALRLAARHGGRRRLGPPPAPPARGGCRRAARGRGEKAFGFPIRRFGLRAKRFQPSVDPRRHTAVEICEWPDPVLFEQANSQ
jgi:hypothetical protein